MGSGCEILIAAKLPSSARQLPILAALHARASTLFAPIIHQGEKKVNTFLKNVGIFLSNDAAQQSCRNKKKNVDKKRGKILIYQQKTKS